MKWENEGYLLSKIKFRENASIINVFTKNYGKTNGIVYGGNSRKIRNYLQVGNKIFSVYNSKSDNKIGYFQTELIEPISAKFFNDKFRASAILSTTSILNSLLPEGQSNLRIYNSYEKFIQNIEKDNWTIFMIYWELDLIKELGFGVELKRDTNDNFKENELIDTTIDQIKYKIPFFLLQNKMPKNIDKNVIKSSLSFTRNLLLNKFFLPNNLFFPKTRVLLENYFND